MTIWPRGQKCRHDVFAEHRSLPFLKSDLFLESGKKLKEVIRLLSAFDVVKLF
jgi:hypothetical protein